MALLVRVPRGAELTDAGRELLDKARTVLDAAEQALTIGRPVEPAGRLAVGVAIAGHRDHWFELGEAFTARYPRVEVEIRTALSELLQRQVVGGELDLAIVLEPNRLPGLSYQEVRAEPLSVWMHAAHPLAGCAQLRLADLDGVAVTVMGRDTTVTRTIQRGAANPSALRICCGRPEGLGGRMRCDLSLSL